MISCPHCGSAEHYFKVSVLYESETSDIETKSTGVGVGISGGGIGVGVGRGTTRGTQQSRLAGSLRPPKPPPKEGGSWRGAGGVLAVVFGGMGFLLGYAFKVTDFDDIEWWLEPRPTIGLIAVGLLLLNSLWIWPPPKRGGERQRNYRANRQAWNRKWFCKRCGKFSTPDS